MSRRPLIAMSIAYLLLLFAAYGTGGLWPVYVAQLGGRPSAAGIFNAAGDLAIIVATLLSGWLADRYRRRKELFYISCLLFAATWWLMSRAVTWQQLTLINVFGGFTFGIATNLIIILTGLLAGETERGRSFGLLTFMMGASLFVGGLACGPIADRSGFPALLVLDAFVCLACLLHGLLFAEPGERFPQLAHSTFGIQNCISAAATRASTPPKRNGAAGLTFCHRAPATIEAIRPATLNAALYVP